MTDSSLKMLIPQVASCVSKVMDGIRRDMKDDGAADILKWSFFLATDVIGELTFGESFQMLEHGKVSSCSAIGGSYAKKPLVRRKTST